MLTASKKLRIIELALEQFWLQKGILFAAADFDLIVDKPSHDTLCSIYINSITRADDFTIKLYVKGFAPYTKFSHFTFIQDQEFAGGLNDEVQLAEVYLDRIEFAMFQRFLVSDQFKTDIVEATDFLLLEDDSGSLIGESSTAKILLES